MMIMMMKMMKMMMMMMCVCVDVDVYFYVSVDCSQNPGTDGKTKKLDTLQNYDTSWKAAKYKIMRQN
jgi:hypothetical protein